MSKTVKLYYVYDPMCSWCWGYKPVWKQIEQAVQQEVEVQYLLGGLAPDSDIPMPIEMQKQIASYWKKIENYLGTPFNYDFWTNNTPRRSTYPSCRATLAARTQGKEIEMLEAIQKAYYLDAKNPSDDQVLIQLADDIGLDSDIFKGEFLSDDIHKRLLSEISVTRSIGGNSFPSLFIEKNGTITELPVDYQSASTTISQILGLTT
ncbi:DsbA family protein [Vibrio tapetis subsp. quintayensis]|uniref:DsbA family protein n=1 Tax=Vibrio tapetis TaxID=52443 RepID=UPI0025B59DE8|nr:DsbA family protein [Vibrio tapetis]MDN3680684.1 DsbA family protein [Vibrio tapetis subsp. quintayensis]